MSVLDNFISWYSPSLALKRARNFAALDEIRKFEAGQRGRRTDGWNATASSAQADTAGVLSTIIGRSRTLAKNNPYAKKAYRVVANNTVGRGIRPAPDAVGELDQLVKNAWKQFAETNKIDIAGRKNFYQIQKLVMKTVYNSGSAIVRIIIRNDKNNPVQLQVLEPDMIDTAKDGMLDGTRRTVQGIEIDEYDRPVAYWIFRTHPGDTASYNYSSVRVPASQVLHIFLEDRPGQVHGVPEGVAAMLKLYDLDGYEDAQLVKQKVSACFTAFVTGDPDAATGSLGSDNVERLEPGVIEYLPDGKNVTFANPPSVDNYDAYTKSVLRGVAAGYSVTYEALTGDLTGVNFSSGRMGWLEFQRQISEWQDMLVVQLCQPVWDLFVKYTRLAGGQDFSTVSAHWTPPRREMIDPGKETAALKEAVRNGFMSWSDVVRQLGLDPDEVAAELKKDWANGLIVDSNPSQDVNRLKNESTKESN